MIPAVAVQQANALLDDIGLSVFVDETATRAAAVGAEARVIIRTKILKTFQQCHIQK